MKKPSVIFLFVIWITGLFAQQEPQFNQYMFNRTLLNPAAAGVSREIGISGFGRLQWIGYEDNEGNGVNPKTYGIALDMPVYAISSGVGLTFRHFTGGAEKSIDIRLQYAYHLSFHKKHTLSFGLAFGLLSKTIDYSGLIPSEFDPLIDGATAESGLITDIGLGVHYQFGNKFYAGISSMNLLGSSAEIGGPDFTLDRHYYLFSGYDIELNGGSNGLVLTPGILVKTATGAFNADINAILTYNEFFWGGLVYRVDNAVGMMAGINYNGLRAGISYDYTLSKDFAKGSRNSVEIFVKYSYPISPKVVKRSGYNTRNL
jgi:type IX secretion system PorP/SprF family membrane protein